jgi:plastocyanin
MHSRQIRTGTTQVFPWLTIVLLTALPGTVSGQEAAREIDMTMGDYHYAPDVIEMESGQSIVLQLTNTDSITPHNFTLVDKSAGLDVDTDIAAGDSVRIRISTQQPGAYTGYCNRKLPFMKSHRDRGMQGTLIVK